MWYGVGSVTPLFSREVFERDLRAIKESGVRYVRLWVNWRDCEPSPGSYRFDLLEELMDASRRVGLRVIAQVYLEFAPDWLPRLFPDALFTSETGSRLYFQGSPGVCLDCRAARDKAGAFLKALARFLKDYENFHAWDVWSEPQVVQWVFHLGQRRYVYCYCRYSVERFREWLRRVYGKEPEQDRALYQRFLIDGITEVVRRVAELARSLRPGIEVSAAVFPSPQDVFTVLQDWPRWVNEGILDYIATMSYTTDFTVFKSYVSSQLSAIADPRKLLVGIGAWRLLDVQLALQLSYVVEELNLRGAVLFNVDGLLSGNLIDTVTRLRMSYYPTTLA